MTLNKGDKVTLSGRVLPDNATEQGLYWSTSDTSVAIVSQAGGVVAVHPGVCKIKATSMDKETKYAECEVRVLGKGEHSNEVADALLNHLVVNPNPFDKQLHLRNSSLSSTR